MSLGFYVLGICSVYGHFLGVSWGVQVHFSHFIDHGRPAEHNWTLSSPFRTQLVCVDHWRHRVVLAGRTERENVSRIPSITSSTRPFCCYLAPSPPFRHHFGTEGPISHTLSTPVVQVGSVARGGDEVWSCFAWVLFFFKCRNSMKFGNWSSHFDVKLMYSNFAFMHFQISWFSWAGSSHWSPGHRSQELLPEYVSSIHELRQLLWGCLKDLRLWKCWKRWELWRWALRVQCRAIGLMARHWKEPLLVVY